MQSTSSQDPAWDFSPVFDLLQSLKSQASQISSPRHENELPPVVNKQNSSVAAKYGSLSTTQDLGEQLEEGLGNFDKIWDFLGVQRDAPVPSALPFESSTAAPSKGYDAYASDGALYYPPSSKAKPQGQEWWDLTESADDFPKEASGLTKNQRKKRNRKLRKAAEAAKIQDETQNETEMGATSHDTTQPNKIPPFVVKTHDEKGNKISANAASSSSDEKHGKSKITSQKVSTKPANNVLAKTPKKVRIDDSTVKSDIRQVQAAEKSSDISPWSAPSAIEEARNRVQNALKTSRNETPPRQPAATTARSLHESLQKQFPTKNVAHQPFPAPQSTYVTPTRQPAERTFTKSDNLPFPVIEQKPHDRLRHEILPLVNQSATDRNWSLFLKLLGNFPEDRKYLVSPLQLSINRPQPDGIHVFVDASNILIGFYDHLKAARGFPTHARVPRVDLNFHALALLLERRRPVAKRVLAGSTPEVHAFEEARQVGYETCILDKVWKAKELTEKQKRLQTRDGYNSGGNGYASGSESAGNGLSGASSQKPKWVEQAVDEILHLKILESVVDTHIPANAVPSGKDAEEDPWAIPEEGRAPVNRKDPWSTKPPVRPTMVLATGDAAEAEYSAGFRKMVERALKSGWIVEVMAFGRSISMEYRRMEKLSLAKGGWGERFKIIELDQYSEELFGQALS